MKLPTAKFARDTGLYVFGMLGIGNEALFQQGDRPTLLVLFASMVGLPTFLRRDEQNRHRPPPVTPTTQTQEAPPP